MPINPYARWLGLPESLQQPNYFELLGLPKEIGGSSTDQSADELGVKKLVSQAAKQKLMLLTQVSAAEKSKNSAVIQKLEERIVRATEVLKDPNKRSAYLKKIDGSKKLDGSGKSGKRDGSERLEKPERSEQERSNRTQNFRFNESPRLTIEKLQRSASIGDVEAEIPFAVPLEQRQGSVPVPDLLRGDEPAIAIAIPSLATRISNRQRRKRNATYQSIIGLLGITICGGLGVVLFWMINQTDLVNRLSSQVGTPSPVEVVSPNSPPLSTPKAEGWQENQERFNEDSQIIGVTPATSSNHDSSHAQTDRPTSFGGSLSDFQQYQLEKQLRQIFFWMGQRDLGQVTAAMDRHEEMMTAWATDADAKSSLSSQQLSQLSSLLRRAVQLHRGFWRQFELGLARLSGGVELTYQGKIVAFVEKNVNEIVIRDSGKNLHFFWQHLPASLAIEIAEQATIVDIPTWRLQQAVYLVTRPINNSNDLATSEELLNLAAADGHPTERLKSLLTKRYFGQPITFEDLNVEPLEPLAQSTFLNELRQKLNYFDPHDLTPAEADQICRQWLDMDEKDPAKYRAILEEAVFLASVSKNMQFIRAIHLELEQFGDGQSLRWELEHWLSISKSLVELDFNGVLELKIAYERILSRLGNQKKIDFEPQIELLAEALKQFSEAHQIDGFARMSGRLQ